MNSRTHRKIFVIDGSVGFIGGVGIADQWWGHAQSRKQLEQEREQLLDSERAARGEAERANYVKDEFLATLSHELRTPLNAILGWSQLLNSKSDQVDLEQGLDAIQRNARAQTQLIADLLDMSRIISGKVRLSVQPTDLAAVIESAIESVETPQRQRESISGGFSIRTRVLCPVIQRGFSRLFGTCSALPSNLHREKERSMSSWSV
jgi:signal transduction histidine kinase